MTADLPNILILLSKKHEEENKRKIGFRPNSNYWIIVKAPQSRVSDCVVPETLLSAKLKLEYWLYAKATFTGK